MSLDHWLDGVKYTSAQECNDGKRRVEKTLEISWRNEWHFQDWFLRFSDYGDCSGSFELDLDILIKLRDKCEEVLNNKNLAKELLPDYYNQYDNYYWDSIKNTYSKLNELINNNEYDWYEYSWWA